MQKVAVLSAHSTNEFGDGPACITVEADQRLIDLVTAMSAEAKRLGASEIRFRWWTLQAWDTVIATESCEGTDDPTEFMTTATDLRERLKGVEERKGIRGETLVVSSYGAFHFTCYCKYTDDVYETIRMSLDEWSALPVRTLAAAEVEEA